MTTAPSASKIVKAHFSGFPYFVNKLSEQMKFVSYDIKDDLQVDIFIPVYDKIPE